MKKILPTIIIILLFCTNVFAYQIIATDDVMYVYQDSNFKKDSHKYRAIYEVDEQNKTLTEIEAKDLNAEETYSSGAVYDIISHPYTRTMV